MDLLPLQRMTAWTVAASLWALLPITVLAALLAGEGPWSSAGSPEFPHWRRRWPPGAMRRRPPPG